MREWLVIESAYSKCLFYNDDKEPKGYIPRDAAERLLGRDLGGMVWFTREESQRMREHPEWRDKEPPHSPLWYWADTMSVGQLGLSL